MDDEEAAIAGRRSAQDRHGIGKLACALQERLGACRAVEGWRAAAIAVPRPPIGSQMRVATTVVPPKGGGGVDSFSRWLPSLNL